VLGAGTVRQANGREQDEKDGEAAERIPGRGAHGVGWVQWKRGQS
jgi:hypothetical protein